MTSKNLIKQMRLKLMMSEVEIQLKTALNESKSYKNYQLPAGTTSTIALEIKPESDFNIDNPTGMRGKIEVELLPPQTEFFDKKTLKFSARIIYNGNDVVVSPIIIKDFPISPLVTAQTEIKCPEGQIFKGFDDVEAGKIKCLSFSFKCKPDEFLYYINGDYSEGKCASMDKKISCSNGWVKSLTFNNSIPQIGEPIPKAPLASETWSFTCEHIEIDPWSAEVI